METFHLFQSNPWNYSLALIAMFFAFVQWFLKRRAQKKLAEFKTEIQQNIKDSQLTDILQQTIKKY